MVTAHNSLEQEVKKYQLRIAKGSTMAEMLLKHIGGLGFWVFLGGNVVLGCVGFLFLLIWVFFWGYLTLSAYKSIEGGMKISRSKKVLKWYGFQSVPYRSRPIHFLSLEGTTKETRRISKRLPKIMINEKNWNYYKLEKLMAIYFTSLIHFEFEY